MHASTRLVLSLVLLTGCARDLHFGDDSRYLDAAVTPDSDTDPDGDAALPPTGGPHVTHAFSGDALLTNVDATGADNWVYLDLDTGAETTPASPADDATWDLAFRRSNIAVNGGVTGTGGVEVASLRVAFDDVTAAPTSGFETDLADSDDEDTLPDYAFRFWYLYDVNTHILTPDAITYVVRTTEGAVVKVRIAGYYDGFGTSGRPSFRWRALP